MDFNLRPAQRSEAALLSSIIRAAKAHWPYTAQQLALWHEDLSLTEDQLASHPCWVAQAGTKVVGFFLLEKAGVCWALDHLWVLPEFMGQGVGRALLSHAAMLAAKEGAIRISIDADPYAEAFYLACGALRIDTVSAPIEGQPERTRPQMTLQLEAKL